MDTLEANTFATELRRRRGELSLRELARRACCSKSLIFDLEHERRTPTPAIAASLDKALGAGGVLVKLAGTHRMRFSGKRTAAPRDAAGDLFQEWDDVWRRDFLKGVAGTALAAGQPSAAGPLGGKNELLDAHLALRAAQGRMDNLRGASAVYAQAVDHHRQVLAWLANTTTSAERQSVTVLAADTGGFVGFLTYDLGMAEGAIAHYREAATLAQQAGDLSSRANLLGQISRILTEQGHHSRALDLADEALRVAGTRAHPAVRSWLHAVRAHHHACLNDPRSSRADLDASWRLLKRADDGEKPPYIGYLSAAEIGKWTGHAMVRLGRTIPACLTTGKAALDETRAAWPATMVRGSAEMLTTSARTHFLLGEHDIATDLLSHSLTIATATGSARNLRAALALQTQLAATGNGP